MEDDKMHLGDYSKTRAMHNYLDAEVREYAELNELSPDETWALRVETLALMLARTLNERESNSEGFEILTSPFSPWNERLINLLDERVRTMSTEEFEDASDE
jgi:hypothetical protein